MSYARNNAFVQQKQNRLATLIRHKDNVVFRIKECLIYAMLLANPVQNGSSDASDVQFWSEFW